MNLGLYFKLAIEKNASDLHLVEGSIPALRISGELVKLDEKPIPFGELKYNVFKVLDKIVRDRFEADKEIDLALEFYEHRFRINLHYQSGKVGLSARLIPQEIPDPGEIGFEETVYNLTHLKDGLVLVTGPSGAGKSTTLACMINIINRERRAHILTIEDPVEYIFKDQQSIIEQRQLGRDTRSFSAALKSALRQDPNIIMVGEMRDKETISAALTAAKTGHLVLSTLHTSTASETVERIIDYFPASNQSLISSQLSSVLRAVVAQELLPKTGGGLVAAREILINNSAVSNLIRQGRVEQIYNSIQTGSHEGMITMNKAIDNLFKNGLVPPSIAHNRKRDLETKAVYY